MFFRDSRENWIAILIMIEGISMRIILEKKIIFKKRRIGIIFCHDRRNVSLIQFNILPTLIIHRWVGNSPIFIKRAKLISGAMVIYIVSFIFMLFL